jgi:hypothetical protein
MIAYIDQESLDKQIKNWMSFRVGFFMLRRISRLKLYMNGVSSSVYELDGGDLQSQTLYPNKI